MLLRTDGGLRAIRVIGEEHGCEGREEFALVAAEADVVFLIDGFQFGMETADDHVLETVRLNLGPVLHFV